MQSTAQPIYIATCETCGESVDLTPGSPVRVDVAAFMSAHLGCSQFRFTLTVPQQRS